MRLLMVAALLEAVASLPQQAAATNPIVLAAGTKIPLVLPGPIWRNSVALGKSVDGVTTFPVTANSRIAIPPGTYAQGRIDIAEIQGVLSQHAEFRIEFAQLVFADGSVVALPADTAATIHVMVGRMVDVLLDTGAPAEMALGGPLALDAERVAAAARRSRPPDSANWKSVVRCVPDYYGNYPPPPPPDMSQPPPQILFPPTPIPTVPGTPFLPGSPQWTGGPGEPCPNAPVVIARPFVHTESFSLKQAVGLGQYQLKPGKYQITWQGLGPGVGVGILYKGAPFATGKARVEALGRKAERTGVALRTAAGGTVSLESLQFAGRTYGLRFDH